MTHGSTFFSDINFCSFLLSLLFHPSVFPLYNGPCPSAVIKWLIPPPPDAKAVRPVMLPYIFSISIFFNILKGFLCFAVSYFRQMTRLVLFNLIYFILTTLLILFLLKKTKKNYYSNSKMYIQDSRFLPFKGELL